MGRWREIPLPAPLAFHGSPGGAGILLLDGGEASGYRVPGLGGETMVPRVLIVGCGNASRRDDGVGLYVVRGLARAFGLPLDEEADEVSVAREVATPEGPVHLQLRFEQQLDIVLGDELKDVDLFAVIDAHTGVYPEALRRVEAEPGYTSSLTSHHLTADTLAGLSQALHGRAPRTFIFSVLGHDFNFGEDLTPQTQAAADEAVRQLRDLVQEAARAARA